MADHERWIANCVTCGEPFMIKGHKKTCSADCSRKYRNARIRAREHMRRTDICDVTPEDELTMRRKARKCPLCGVRLTDKPNLPNSKHLDHILPIGVGGTHTWGNLRVLCAACNLSRPKDGSDFTGQLTLWAQGPVPMGRPKKTANTGTCRKGLHPWIPENILITGSGKKLCGPCRRSSEQKRDGSVLKQCRCGAVFPAPGRTFMCAACTEATAHRAAELHAGGGLTWQQIAEQVGYESGTGAWYAAKRIGYIPAPRVPSLKPGRTCPDCGMPLRGPRPRCEECQRVRILRAAHLRYDLDWSMWDIAREFGYSSGESVRALLKSDAAIEVQHAQPVMMRA